MRTFSSSSRPRRRTGSSKRCTPGTTSSASLGDGINDSPALKAADVGISVDTAVDIAKESADIILLEKNLLVLQKGVVEGRKVFANIVKYIKMGASSNFGNMFSVLGASIFLPFLPMAPIQVLTNNLLYDFSQTTIPTDNVDEEFLASPRRWEIGNIFKFMVFIGPISSIFDYVTYGMMLFVFGAWTNPALFQTGWFVEVFAYADSDHPHHSHEQNSFHREPRQPGACSPRPSSSARWGFGFPAVGSAPRSASFHCPGSIGRWSPPSCSLMRS